MDLIDEIERLRLEQGISQADMAREFGVPSQNYNNWVYRHSLPKSHYPKAQKLIAQDRSELKEMIGGPSIPKYMMSAISGLEGSVTPRSRDAIRKIIEATNNGSLTEDDVLLLERIAKRFEKPTP